MTTLTARAPSVPPSWWRWEHRNTSSLISLTALQYSGQKEQPGPDHLRQRGQHPADAASRLQETNRHVGEMRWGAVHHVDLLYFSNNILPCHSPAIPKVDLSPWREETLAPLQPNNINQPVGYFQDEHQEPEPFDRFNVNSIFTSLHPRRNLAQPFSG